MTNHVLLNNVTHKDLTVNRVYSAAQGDNINVARVFPVEYIQLQMEYPLFFLKNNETGHFETVALLGFTEQENLYLDDNGWNATYIPISIEREPFLIGFQEQNVDGVPTEVPVVHVNTNHPSIGGDQGQRVFLEQGGESPYLERINTILMAIHQGHEAAPSFSQMLVGLELIETLAVDIEFKDGSRQGLAGLYTINEEKLQNLNADSLDALHKKGHLRDIYMMLASMPNINRLIAMKNAMLEQGPG